MQARKTVPLPGSERNPARGARVTGPVDGNEPIEVRISLKPPNSLQQKAEELATQSVDKRQYVSREDFEKTFSTDAATIERIQQFASEHNLAVSHIDRAQHVVHLTGAVRDMSQAFQTYLEHYQKPDGVTYRGRTGAIHIPDDLANLIESVNGLDDRPVATPKIRLRSKSTATGVTPHAGAASDFKPQDIAKLYSFPTTANAGQGQCVAIIELGGGFRQSDLNTYFGAHKPTVTAVSVDKGHNSPTGDAGGPDGEVMLDIEVVGAVAPSSNIAVYFAPNTNKGFLDAISAAVHDKTRKPSVISISWGGPEDGGGWSPSVLNAFNAIFQAASLMGVTVLAASGDNGSSDGMDSGNHVDFPASSPWVTGCGGTRLTSDKKTIQSETVWNDGAQGGATGGGISTAFQVPTYQKNLSAALTKGGTTPLTGRGVPDVAGDADPETGYDVRVDGQNFPIGGTSAVAPLMAGLVAILNQNLGNKTVGFMNPLIYNAMGTTAFRDITNGNNGTYCAAKGWDACTGLGVPVGTALLGMLKGQAAKA